jgi:hypothetical protein
MKKNLNILIVLIAFVSFSTTGCQPKEEKNDTKEIAKTPENNVTVNGSVHKLFIIPNEPTFPDVEGRQVFLSNCITCHSTRYISMQPNFPRKTWQAEVTKMIEKFKAPIDTSLVKQIVDYLVRIKGTETDKKTL